MKTSFIRFFVNIWLVLSEVPGWPDAPFTVRLRRVAPMLVALLGLAALAGWKYGWREPDVRAVRMVHAPMVSLEAEVAALGLETSDQQAEEVAGQATAALATLVDSPEALTAHLRQLRDEIRALGWDAVFQAYDATESEAGIPDRVEFAAARCRLVPVAGNPAPFSTLLGVFDRISGGSKRIDLTRLGVRADEPGKLEVEMNLRIACRAPDEKTS